MPSLSQATADRDMSEFQRVQAPPSASLHGPSPERYPPSPNPLLRCPLPPVWITPDSLRQFYKDGEIPQARVLTPPPLTGTTGGSTTTNVFQAAGTTTTPATTAPKANTVSLVTPVLNPGDTFNSTIIMSKAFIIVRVGVDVAARVELYGTSLTQTLDTGRSPFFGVAQNPPSAQAQNGVICDLYLDTSDKFSWLPSWTITGANGDIPQTSIVYATITNISAASTTITTAFTYVPVES